MAWTVLGWASRDQPMHRSHISTDRASDPRAVKILAKSVYRELKQSGYSRSDMVGFTNALLELVTSDVQSDSEPPA